MFESLFCRDLQSIVVDNSVSFLSSSRCMIDIP